MTETVAFPKALAAWAVAWVVGGGFLGALVLAALGGVSGEPLSPIRLAAVALVSWLTLLVAVVAVARSEGIGWLRSVGLGAVPRFRVGDLWAIVAGVVTQTLLLPAVYFPLRAAWSDTFSPDRLSDTARDLVDAADGAHTGRLGVVDVVAVSTVEGIAYGGLLPR